MRQLLKLMLAGTGVWELLIALALWVAWGRHSRAPIAQR
jgi:hypothetical protein